ncbi:hypothetical protein HUJ05_001995 [Dendroctonus ponderosae]|nr:hypothetical protein HUJ05_001995 [Dendroctonus ponderosae]
MQQANIERKKESPEMFQHHNNHKFKCMQDALESSMLITSSFRTFKSSGSLCNDPLFSAFVITLRVTAGSSQKLSIFVSKDMGSSLSIQSFKKMSWFFAKGKIVRKPDCRAMQPVAEQCQKTELNGFISVLEFYKDAFISPFIAQKTNMPKLPGGPSRTLWSLEPKMPNSWDNPLVTRDVITIAEDRGSFQSQPLDLTVRKEPAVNIDGSGTGTYPRKPGGSFLLT